MHSNTMILKVSTISLLTTTQRSPKAKRLHFHVFKGIAM
jgi:hypothetical protein